MSTSQQLALARDYAERIDGLGPVSVHRYFAGASLRAGGVQFAFVMKGILYLKADEESRPAFVTRGSAPFSYRGNAGAVTVAAYYEAPVEILEDDDLLSAWAADAMRAAVSSAPKTNRTVS